MGWRDSYRTASFRGVPFHVETADSSHGRRQAVHEHAQRDVPYTEDLGRKAREFTINGYVIGADYHQARDALVEACEKAGPGHLIHPYKGELTVVCRGLNVSESSENGGMCRVSLTFLEAGEASYPRATTDSVNAIGKAANRVTEAAGSGFLSKYLTKGFPGFVVNAASDKIGALGRFMQSPGFDLLGEIDAAADFIYSAKDLVNDAAALASTPDSLLSRITGLMGMVRGAFGGNAGGMLSGLNASYRKPYTGSTKTPSRKQQAANDQAISELVRQVAIAENAKAASTTTYASRQEAITARDSLLESIDTEAETTTNDEAYYALTSLRAEVVKAVPSPDQSLPQIASYTPRETLPAVLVAYQLYGDASRSDEIVSRNAPRHPGFLVGGQPIEVLTDAG